MYFILFRARKSIMSGIRKNTIEIKPGRNQIVGWMEFKYRANCRPVTFALKYFIAASFKYFKISARKGTYNASTKLTSYVREQVNDTWLPYASNQFVPKLIEAS